MRRPSGTIIARQQLGHLMMLWLACTLAQAAHFHFYYEQSVTTALRWAAVDWAVWVVLVAALYNRWNLPASGRVIGHLAVVAFLAGWAQIVGSTIIHGLFEGLSRPFLNDVWHLYQKRWLQNLLAFGVLWVMMGQILPREARENPDSRVKLQDGGKLQWVEPEQIRYVEAAGNYLCVHTEKDTLVVRQTMKSLTKQLEPHGFLRVSRSCLVNLDSVVACERRGRNRLELHLAGGGVTPIGRTFNARVREMLDL